MRLFRFKRRTPRSRKADALFRRFVQLNQTRFRDLGQPIGSSDDMHNAPSISAACREWYPDLSSEEDRALCKSILDFYNINGASF